MDSCHPLKLKRKDLEDVNDDFSDFSISSPARKIRRLDAELTPRIDEDDYDIPIEFELPEQRPPGDSLCGIRIEELPSNDERAIVVFNPNVLPREPSNFSVSVDHRLLSALKNQAPSSNHSIPWRLGAENDSTSSGNGCLAVVPWVPSSFPEYPSQANNSEMMDVPSQANNSEVMDVQEVEGEGMDIEDGDMEQGNGDGMSSFHQWQQQHCSIPQPPHNAASSIVWYP